MVPDGSRYKLTSEDKEIVVGSLEFVVGFVAEHIPAQVVETDLKDALGMGPSALAIPSRDQDQHSVYVWGV